MANLDLITKLEEVDSTNLFGLQNIANLKDKQVVVAVRQNKGRGRFDRKWLCDGTKNLYMSIILKPQSLDYPFANVTQYLSVCLAKVLEQNYNQKPAIKWPNDILVNNSKISGILCEVSSSNKSINGLVLGVGVNLNMNQNSLDSIDQQATSLNILLNEAVDVEQFTTNLIDEFFKNYDEFVSKGFKYIKKDYVERCFFLNKKITIKNLNEKKEYIALKINDDGSLLVEDENNNICNIITGDLTWNC